MALVPHKHAIQVQLLLHEVSWPFILDTVLTVQAAHGQLLLDLLNEVVTLRADLAVARGASPSASPSDESWLPFGNTSQKGGVHRDRGRDEEIWWDMIWYVLFVLMMGCIC